MEYYTYTLIDPRNEKIFYVGKGQKTRMYDHENAVQRGMIPNKKERINEFLAEVGEQHNATN